MPLLQRLIAVLAAVLVALLAYAVVNSESFEFDVWTGAKLHNKAVAFIVTQSNRTLTTQKFLAAYEEYEKRSPFRLSLTPSVIAFLGKIDVITDKDSSEPFPFTSNLGFPDPSVFWTHQVTSTENPYPSAIMLYPDLLTPGAGLFLDMRTHKASYFNSETGWPRSDEWWPLDMALKRYQKLYLGGKYHYEGRHTIKMEPYTQTDVALLLLHYRALVDAILFTAQDGKFTDRPLVGVDKLKEWGIGGFAAEFLSRAKAPTFKYIAPGVSLPSDASFDALMRKKYGTPQAKKALAAGAADGSLLLFPGEEKVEGGTDDISARLFDNLSGVYLRPTDNFADGIQFVTPFPVGNKGFLRRGHSPFVYSTEAPIDPYWTVTGHDVLYQHGPCPFLPQHLTRLASLIQAWTMSVRKGEFKVGNDGVEGGMEFYRVADTKGTGGVDFDSNICWTGGIDPA